MPCNANFPSHTHPEPGVCQYSGLEPWEVELLTPKTHIFVLSAIYKAGRFEQPVTVGSFSTREKAEDYRIRMVNSGRADDLYDFNVFEEYLDPDFL